MKSTIAPTLTHRIRNGSAGAVTVEEAWEMLRELRALKSVFAAVERMRPYTPGWEDRAIKAWEATARLSRSPARKERRR